jgi:shikimate dehydrogenase
VVLLGAGGAGSAIAHAVLRLGVGELRMVDADAERAAALALELNALLRAGHRANACVTAEQALPGATGLIHATPTGMAKLPGLPLDAALLRAGLWVSEVVYFPLETALLQAARACRLPGQRRRRHGGGPGAGCLRAVHRLPADPARMERTFTC